MKTESIGIPRSPDVTPVPPRTQNQVQKEQGKAEMQTRGQEGALPHADTKSLDLERIGKELNHYMRMFNTYLAFEVDRPSNRIIIKIIDTETEEVIRQIPPEEMLRIMHHIDELLGLLVDERV